MRAKELVEKIYDFEGNIEEWLEFEKEVNQTISDYSEEENIYLEESDAMEYLLMICDGIRFDRKR